MRLYVSRDFCPGYSPGNPPVGQTIACPIELKKNFDACACVQGLQMSVSFEYYSGFVFKQNNYVLYINNKSLMII